MCLIRAEAEAPALVREGGQNGTGKHTTDSGQSA